MDEAGLPDEKRESLKVLHYYLEGHMSPQTEVGFVAISNHVLDAAKSNRCVCLLRAEPDVRELRSIAEGCLFDGVKVPAVSDIIGLPENLKVSVGDLIKGLCRAYSGMLVKFDCSTTTA